MIMMIDNYDSFTWNVVQYLWELGAEVEVYRNDALTLSEIEAKAPSGICISPGPCSPKEAGISMAVIDHFAGHDADIGHLLGPTEYWRRVWRADYSRALGHAR